MKRFNFLIMILAGSLLLFSFSTARAQEQPPPPEGENPQRPNLLRELDLSPDQLRRIRELNKERRPIMQESQRRLREANRALDEAIYADIDNEEEIQARMKEVQTAQIEVIKNRTITETAVRRVLTPQQLMKFRNLRSQFLQMKNRQNDAENRENRMNSPDDKKPRPAGFLPKRMGKRPPPRPVQ